MNSKLRVQDWRLSFGTKEVLKGINMSVPDREIVALVGPSGCGKSTLLRSMNRMHDLVPTANWKGDLFLDEKSIYLPQTSLTEVRRKIGMVFQKPNPFPKSIFENVAYGLRIAGGLSNKELEERVHKAIQQSALWDEVKDQLDQSALSLSGGQQQRLCIARAIAVQPEVLLMDEPCSALDPISTKRIEALMLELVQDYAIVIVTHNLAQARRVAHRTAFMYLGELVEYAETETLFTSPEKELTKRYLQGSFG